MSSRPPSDRAPHGPALRRTAAIAHGRPTPRPRTEPATVPFVAVPTQRSQSPRPQHARPQNPVPAQRTEPPTERFPAVEPVAPAPERSDGLLVRLPDLELSDVPPDPPTVAPPSRPTKLVVPGQRGPQPRKRSRKPVLVIGACVAAAMIGLTAVTGLVSALSSDPPVVAPTSSTTTAP
jgi:hypothetical protein